MLDLYVDIDACPVYREVTEAAHLHRLDLYVVTRGFVVVPAEPMVHPIFAEDDDGRGDDWIANNISTGDICITEEICLAAQCVLKVPWHLNRLGMSGRTPLRPTALNHEGGVAL
jgi:hypothetical protein